MKLGATSDLARLNALQRQAIEARNNLDLSGSEMTTGEKASPFEAAGGNLTRLFSLERALERNAVYSDTIVLNEMRLEIAQEALGRVYGTVETLSVDLLGAVGIGDMSAARLHATSARRGFVETVSTLNSRVAGQALFAGAATNGAALASAETMLAEIEALAAPPAVANAQEAIDAVEAYFTRPGGGFFATGYIGSDVDLSPVEIGDGVRVETGVRADSAELVSVLQAHALGAIVADGAFADDATAQKIVLTAAADRLLDARDNVRMLRTQVGVSQNVMERAHAGRTSERNTFELARTKMIEADPLEAASRYQALEAQLEAIYTVTSRLSQLRFANFMR